MKWSQHAIDRIKETPLKLTWIKRFFKTSSLSTLKKRIEPWKFSRYGMEQFNIEYYRSNLEIIYTVNKNKQEVTTVSVKNRATGEVWGKDLF